MAGHLDGSTPLQTGGPVGGVAGPCVGVEIPGGVYCPVGRERNF